METLVLNPNERYLTPNEQAFHLRIDSHEDEKRAYDDLCESIKEQWIEKRSKTTKELWLLIIGSVVFVFAIIAISDRVKWGLVGGILILSRSEFALSGSQRS